MNRKAPAPAVVSTPASAQRPASAADQSPRSLYCGADLPPEVARAAAERRGAVQTGVPAAPTRAVAPESLEESSKNAVVDGIVDAIDIAGTIADGISIIGDLLD